VLLDRYLVREINASFLAVAIVLSVVFLAYSLTRFLSDAASGLLVAAEVAQLTLYKSIIAFEVLLPLAFYFGLIVGFGQLNVHGEMTAMRASGLRKARLQLPLLSLGLVLALVVGALSMLVRPWAYGEIFALKDAANATSELDRIKAQKFYLYDDGQRAVYIENISNNHAKLDGIFIRTRDGDALEIISAPSGKLEAYVSATLHRLTLTNASILRSVDGATDFYGRFDTLSLALDAQNPRDDTYRTKAQTTRALWASKSAADQAELQWRLSTPVSTLLLTLTALLMTSSVPRQGRFAHLPIAIGVYAVYYNLLGLARTWVEQQAVTSLWWVPVVLASLLGLTTLIQRRQLL
jgi:lipopolysaccharide export system permease protein